MSKSLFSGQLKVKLPNIKVYLPNFMLHCSISYCMLLIGSLNLIRRRLSVCARVCACVCVCVCVCVHSCDVRTLYVQVCVVSLCVSLLLIAYMA